MESKVSLKVLFFAKIRELLKVSSEDILIENKSCGKQVIAVLESKFPELVQLRGSYILALNEDYLANLDDNLNLTSGLQMIQSCFFILLLIQILPGTKNVSFDKAVI